MSAAVAKYSQTSRDHNRLLLVALIESWGSKCYWCRTPKSFRELQIDHILPRRPREGANADGDLDAATNLAPICGPCNQEKGNEDYQNTPRVESQLKLANSRAPAVQRSLDQFHKDTTVTKALLAVTAADLEDNDVAGAVAALGGVVLNVLRTRFPEIIAASYAKDYTEHRPAIEFDGGIYQPQSSTSLVDLDGASRRVAVILEDALDIPMRHALDTVREWVSESADEEVQRWVRGSADRSYRDVSVHSAPSHNPIGVYFHEMRYNDGTVEVDGEFDGIFTADIEEDDPDPEGWPMSRGAEFSYDGEFTATFALEGLMDIGIHVNEPSEIWWHRTLHSMEQTD